MATALDVNTGKLKCAKPEARVMTIIRGESGRTTAPCAKTTSLTESVKLQFRFEFYNLFNHMFLGVPDPLIEDGNLANQGGFGNNLFNSSGGAGVEGGGYTNFVLNGLGRRRMILGAKITF